MKHARWGRVICNPYMHDAPQVSKPCVTCRVELEWELLEGKTFPKGGSFQCNRCKAKRGVAYRVFGKWPIDCFKELSDDAQVEFWKSSLDKDSLVSNLIKHVSEQRINENINSFVGKWLPKDVWVRKGYNGKAIEAGCEKKWDEELKMNVYKKNVEVDVKAEITRNVRDEIINLKNKDFRAKLSHYASTPSPAKKNKKKRKHHKRPRSASSGKSDKSSKSSNSSKSSKSSKSSGSDSEATKKRKIAAAAKEEKTRKILEAKEKKKADAAAAKKAKTDKEAAERQAVKDSMGYIYYSRYKHVVTTALNLPPTRYDEVPVKTACLWNPIATYCF